MKKTYLEPMRRRLTEDDRELLQAIYEPCVVTIPPNDACRSLCVTPDGEIRIYGALNKKQPEDIGTRVYISSTDCGLSWKTHLLRDPHTIGCAGYNPHTGRFISTCPDYYRPDFAKTFDKPGTWAVLNDEGFDCTENRFVKLSDLTILISRIPMYMESTGRWFILGQYTDEHHVLHPTIFYSDDDGESWTMQMLRETAPAFEITPPHKGVRWQQYSCEPTLVETTPGELLMIVRTSQDYYYQYRSHDNGVTWSSPEPSPFHGTITMPTLEKLEDGRIVFFWCSTQPMPELDQSALRPPLNKREIAGLAEDFFTNRDANHMAISEDNAATWIGSRELFLNEVRSNADFRSVGGVDSRDKSVHQGQMLELPYNKLLIHFGQNESARRVMILDIDWLYEQQRHEDFRLGLQAVTTHMFVNSNPGNYRGFSGHCAYNRTHGALLVPDPDENFEEVLQICRIEDPRLAYKKQGVVWNFPASRQGTVTVDLRVHGSGAAVSLCDHWYNAFDETVPESAAFSIAVTREMCPADRWTRLSMHYDLDKGTVYVTADDRALGELPIRQDAPLGLNYLHIQTLAEAEDTQGTLVREMHKTV
ncbi:MAG: exo-alpha-sialidase [Ruminococcaceae bacterium]|nr:exo-alpha-sialidase [Oscillospiraceae bacterium]